MIAIRRARPADAAAIAAVHVAAWRSAYPGILPDEYLARLSVARHAAQYESAIRGGVGVHVAAASGLDIQGGLPTGLGPRIVGFASADRARMPGIGEGEIETLYVLDDWRERGLGRRLIRAAAAHLASSGCSSAYLWVLRDNPSRWFYQRLGGRPVAETTIRVGGVPVVQIAFAWDPIGRLLQASPQAS
ncbi:MAG: GNAT family N-acetyltransferase [Acidisphaera sp.]|nr:GNAT family N-acetyltransferase [Acidisphaera sp.]